MSWETKISRTVRVVNSQEMGAFARLLTAIANAGGNIGGIELLNETSHQVVRDITVFADDEASLEQILAAIRRNRGTRLLDVRDDVLALHLREKSPFAAAIRSIA